jgi:hypothetical protein
LRRANVGRRHPRRLRSQGSLRGPSPRQSARSAEPRWRSVPAGCWQMTGRAIHPRSSRLHGRRPATPTRFWPDTSGDAQAVRSAISSDRYRRRRIVRRSPSADRRREDYPQLVDATAIRVQNKSLLPLSARRAAHPGTPDTHPPAAPPPGPAGHRNGHANKPGANPQHARQAPIVTNGTTRQGCPK